MTACPRVLLVLAILAVAPVQPASADQISHHVGHVIDLLPTCLEVAGAKYPSPFDGRTPLPLEGKSLAPIFHGRKPAEHEMLCWNVPNNQAIRVGRWKLVNPARGKPWQLYDLEADGVEMHDLAAQYPERVQEMAAQWQDWARRTGK